MNITATRIKQAMEDNNLKQSDLAQKTNINKSAISQYLSGKIMPKQDKIYILAKALNVSPVWLLGYDRTPTLKNTEDQSPKKDINFLPSHHYSMVPYSVSAGSLSEIESLVDLPTVSVPDSMLGRYAGSKHIILMPVNGESMNNVIDHESIIAVKIDVTLPDLHDGDIVVISNDGDYTVKRYYNDTVNQRFIFRPDSKCPSFTDIIFDYDNCDNLKLIGRVVMYNVFL